jgi:hypothetical protein
LKTTAEQNVRKAASTMPAVRSQQQTLRSRTPVPPPDPQTTKLEDVRDEVRRFILNQVSIGEFHDALNGAIGRDELAPHPLTSMRFRKIVKEVIRERKSDAVKRKGTRERKKHS